MKWTSFKKDLLNSEILSYLPFLSLIPCLLSFYFLYTKADRISSLEEKVVYLQKKVEKKKQTSLQEEKILSAIQKSNPNYVEEKLGSLSFLIPEQQKWKMFLAQLESSTEMQKKYAFLETLDNKLTFTETAFQKTSIFEERELTQQRPVNLNEEDLKKLLSAVESVEIKPYHLTDGAPQMLITAFSLEKTTFPEMQEKIYTVKMNLLTRQKALSTK